MRHINGVYTQRFNRFHGCDGQLFRGRYKSILVDEDAYLLQLVRYIHRNPVEAGLVDKLDAMSGVPSCGSITAVTGWPHYGDHWVGSFAAVMEWPYSTGH